ncbi:MAG: electron transport complex subunit RsxG [Gammaproteobacteria bacterium]|nr:electron transport complex subunit RsxG [Gammaproteobacteria bacterium]
MTDDRSIAKSGATLAVIAAICTALVAGTYQMTAARIAANEKALLERSLQPALAGVFYDSSVTESRLILEPPHGLPGTDPALIYRVYSKQQAVAALFVVTARGGYSGPIRILLGVDMDGVVTGLRILEHRETPGLGDRIESSRSDWVLQFDGRSIGDPVITGWSIKGDGGEFDQLTGASITPRAVINAVRDTLIYFSEHRDDIFATSATEVSE